MRGWQRAVAATAVVGSAAAILGAACVLPSWGANALLHPARRPLAVTPDLPFTPLRFAEHPRRIFDALLGPKRLLPVEGAGHNDALARDEVWREIETFIAGVPVS